nr:Ig-like domain-containing protein [Eubacterium sp.]
MKRQIMRGMMAMTMLFAMASIGSAAETEAAKVKAPYTKQAYIAKGKKIRLTANKKVTFSIKNKSIATVTKKGVVTAKKVGKTKIVVTEQKNKKKKTVLSVRVVKAAVKKVTLKKKAVSLDAGKQMALKVTVKAKKGASKRLHWTSSKPAVASVSKKGIVTAKRAGNAVVTVKAADGSGKKATCKVTVKGNLNGLVPGVKPITPTDSSLKVTEMTIRNPYSLTFSLSRPYALDLNAVVVKRKVLSGAEYQDTLDIDTLQTADKIHYTVTLAGNNSIQESEYVKLEINGLSQNGTMEQQFKPTPHRYVYEGIYTGTVGEFVEIYLSDGNQIGYMDATVTGLPDGLSWSNNGSRIRIIGNPTRAGVYLAQVQAVDEAGNKFDKTYHFCIGSPEVIVASATKTYGIVEKRGSASYQTNLFAAGGSGEYTYELLDAKGGIVVDAESGAVSMSTEDVGEYYAKVKVSDRMDPSKFAEVLVEFSIAQGLVLEGTVKDAEGNTITDTTDIMVDFDLHETDNRYYEGAYKYYSIASNGVFRAILPAGTYDILTRTDYAGGGVYVYDYVLSQEKQETTIALPVYRVELCTQGQDELLKDVAWGNAENILIGYDKILYLKKGRHTLQGSWYGFMNWKTHGKATFEIVDKGVKVNLDVTVEEGEMTSLSLAEPGTINVSATTTKHGYFSFTPTETGVYRIYSAIPKEAGYNNTQGVLYNSQRTLLDSNDYNYNHPIEGNQFMMETSLTAGETYYIGARYCYSSSSDMIPVVVEKVQ